MSAGIAGAMALFAFMPASKAAQTYTVRYSAPSRYHITTADNIASVRYAVIRNVNETYNTAIPDSSSTKPVAQQPLTVSYPNTSSAPKPSTPAAPAAGDTESTPVTSDEDYALTSEENEMVGYINEERVKSGLKALAIDPELASVARLKAQDMRDKNYFSHTSPTYGSPFDMMKQFGLTYRTAGENIAKNSSVLKAHLAFMNSDGHKANILNGTFTHVGVGIVDYQGGKIVVEMFIGR
ncbi:CAP domain-containing protein [Mahella australiensis]|uniref:CAP domain-containing protein n=1 Tax=Mahella australiensis TaxID=252966 RepID=UPI000673FE9F|nr:CAP domain-containing protein [Mahella australiensis]